jgi:hypothetical protein
MSLPSLFSLVQLVVGKWDEMRNGQPPKINLRKSRHKL